MQRLEVSGAVRPLCGSLGVKGLTTVLPISRGLKSKLTLNQTCTLPVFIKQIHSCKKKACNVHSSKYDRNTFQGFTTFWIRCHKQRVSAIVTTIVWGRRHGTGVRVEIGDKILVWSFFEILLGVWNFEVTDTVNYRQTDRMTNSSVHSFVGK